MKRTESPHILLKKVQQFIKTKGLLKPNQKVLLGISGGIDSVVLLDILITLRDILNLEIVAAHVNYGLRGKESDGDERFVQKLAKKYEIECFVQHAETKKLKKKQNVSIQVVARNIRYSFFDNLKKLLAADVIVTAHNTNDNAETMLMNFVRGSGIDGISGIPVQRKDIVRPLLCLSRKEIVQYAKAHKLQFREDSSNLEDDYTRNFIRHRIIPKLEKRINPSIIETLRQESETFRAAAEFVSSAVDDTFESIVESDTGNFRLSIKKLTAQHSFIRQMIVRRLFTLLGAEPGFTAISSVLDLLDHQKGKFISLGKNITAERLENDIIIGIPSKKKSFLHIVTKEGTMVTDEFDFTVEKSPIPENKTNDNPSIEYVDASLIRFPITIRSWKQGDHFFPLGLNGKKKVSDFFVDLRLSNRQKQHVPIIECGKKIVWIAGRRLDDRFKITPSTTDVFKLSLTTIHGKKDYHR